jgi:hypothetical protein
MTTETTASGAVGLGRGGRMSRKRKRDAVLRLLRGEDAPKYLQPQPTAAPVASISTAPWPNFAPPCTLCVRMNATVRTATRNRRMPLER